jgi:hypothetical protein
VVRSSSAPGRVLMHQAGALKTYRDLRVPRSAGITRMRFRLPSTQVSHLRNGIFRDHTELHPILAALF